MKLFATSAKAMDQTTAYQNTSSYFLLFLSLFLSGRAYIEPFATVNADLTPSGPSLQSWSCWALISTVLRFRPAFCMFEMSRKTWLK
jgi:hypothetical protein